MSEEHAGARCVEKVAVGHVLRQGAVGQRRARRLATGEAATAAAHVQPRVAATAVQTDRTCEGRPSFVVVFGHLLEWNCNKKKEMNSKCQESIFCPNRMIQNGCTGIVHWILFSDKTQKRDFTRSNENVSCFFI